MAIESFFRRLGLRRDPTAQDHGVAASVLVYSNHGSEPVERRQNIFKKELAQYPGLEQYPEALAYLARIGVSPADLQAIYPDFEDFAESEFDDRGHAFRYMEGPYQHYRLDRVIFPSDTHYPYTLAVDRQMRYSPHRQHSFGLLLMPERRIRMNVYPDTSVSLQLQTATSSDLTDIATFFIDPDGAVDYSEHAMRASHFLHDDEMKHQERPVPQRLHTITDPSALQSIPYFSQEYLEQQWDLTEADIAVPSQELARKILTAPVETGVDLRAILAQ